MVIEESIRDAFQGYSCILYKFNNGLFKTNTQEKPIVACKPSEEGITLQFYTKQLKFDGPPLFGRFTDLFGVPRSERLKRQKPPAKDNGSTEWLSYIVIADTEKKRDDIVKALKRKKEVPKNKPCQTSCCSRVVTIELHLGGVRATLPELITISTGASFIESDGEGGTRPRVAINHVKAFPKGAPVDEGDTQFHREWDGMTPSFVVQTK